MTFIKVLRHPAVVKGTATGGHRDGRVVEKGLDGADSLGAAFAARHVLEIAVTGDERDRRPSLELE
jgi:hypothetical protein